MTNNDKVNNFVCMYAQIYTQTNVATIFQKQNFFLKVYMNLSFGIDIAKLPA